MQIVKLKYERRACLENGIQERTRNNFTGNNDNKGATTIGPQVRPGLAKRTHELLILHRPVVALSILAQRIKLLSVTQMGRHGPSFWDPTRHKLPVRFFWVETETV